MYVLNTKANYYLEKQNSYCITKYFEKSQSGHWRFQTFAQKQSIFQCYFVPFCSLNDFRQTKHRRVFIVHQLSFIISQNYRSHATSTLYKPDTSLRRTVELGPDVVRLRESSLYLYEQKSQINSCQLSIDSLINARVTW